MIVGGSYKQQCPSCEAMVLIKSPALVGKKIECPKCKDRFIVAKPVPANKPADIDEDEEAASASPPPRSDKLRAGKPPLKKPAAESNGADHDSDAELKPVKKTTLRVHNEELDENGAEDKPSRPDLRVKPGAPGKKPPLKLRDTPPEDDEELTPAKVKPRIDPRLKKPAAPAPPPQQEPASDAAAGEGEDAEAPVKPKKKRFNLNFNLKFKFGNLGNKKMALGLGLAVVGVVVLGAAAYFILGGSPTGPGPRKFPFPTNPPPVYTKNDPKKGDPKGKKEDKGKGTKEDKGKGTTTVVPPPEDPNRELEPPGPDLTNLFPEDTEQVVRINFKGLFDSNTPFYDAMFNAFTVSGPFTEALFYDRLGFNVTKINEIHQAERFSGLPWTLNVIHVNENLNMGKIAYALGAVKQPAIKAQEYYKVVGNHWMEQIGRLGLGVPPSLRYMIPSREGRPILIRRHNHQTLVVGDEEPMKEFLSNEGQFPFYGTKKDPKKAVDPKKAEPTVRGGTYMTIKPELKALIERGWPGDDSTRDIFLYTAGSDLAASQAVSRLPQNRGLILYRPRPLWDLTCMLEERKPRIKTGNVSVVMRPKHQLRFRTELGCFNEMDAKDLNRELFDVALPRILQLADLILDYKIEAPSSDGRKSANPANSSVILQGSSVTVNMDLGMDSQVFGRAVDLFSLLMVDARAELALWEGGPGELRQQLAHGAKRTAVKGLDKRFAPGTFPPGTFPRPGKDRVSRDPSLRISWMASLLPYLGHEKLYEKIVFESSWQDAINLPVGRTTVAQFQDPTYPEWSRSVPYPDMLAEYAATHFVGVSGVGLDAAELPLGHPKRGIFGYDQSASLADVQKGRGLSNTMLMIQVPPDAIGGVTPWIAGGGSTMRGIPETKSVEPFVLTKDRYGKPIQHNGRSGTYVIMADGSVRFVTSKVSDAVMQSMATYQDGSKIDLDKNEDTPRISDAEQEKKEKKSAPKK